MSTNGNISGGGSFTHSLSLNQSTGLTHTHNGNTLNVPFPSGSILQNIGFDSSGNPVISQVAYARRTQTVSQTYASGAVTAINYDVSSYSYGITSSPTSYIVLSGGRYLVGHFFLSAPNVPNSRVGYNVSIYVNGSNVSQISDYEHMSWNIGVNNYSMQGGSDVIQLNALDSVSLRLAIASTNISLTSAPFGGITVHSFIQKV